MTRPNIVLILADDMGYGDFSAFNDGLSQTPTLDSLMRDSVCLTQHYAASPVCSPSRAALLTGRYPHRTGSIDTLDWRGLDRLALREVTLAHVLKKAGYATGLVGKWHLGAFDPRYHPCNRGFDEFVGFRGGWQDYYRWNLEYGFTPRASDGRYLTDVFTEEAVLFIERHRREPFFLHLCYNAPHTPLQAPESEIEPFRNDERLTLAVATLYGMLRRLDKGVRRVLAEIRRHGLKNNTIVLFTSDNGPQFGGLGSHCLDRFNCQFNGAKGSVYEGGIRVPMIIRWPDGLDSGRRVPQMIHMIDWFPTLCAMAGIEPPSGQALDGINVLPVLRGFTTRVPSQRFWQWNRYSPVPTCNAAMRDGDWKLVRPAIREAMEIPPDDLVWNDIMRYEPERMGGEIVCTPEPERVIPPAPPPELYNLAEDPGEKCNLAQREPARVSRMLKQLADWFDSVEADRRSIRDA